VTWQLVTFANIAIAIAYFCISGIIFRGLISTDQLRSNRLGAATGLIFLTCGVHHGAHSVHMLLPEVGLAKGTGEAMRHAWDWQTVAWDFFTAAVGFYYLSMRGSYASVLRGAQMFEDMKARQAQALEINDNIVQGLAVAKASLEVGKDEQGRAAIEETLRRARDIITDLLGEQGSEVELGPGDLRRGSPAGVFGDGAD
jgi:hypothetical protein